MAKEREPAAGVVVERRPHRPAGRERDPAAPLLGFDVELHVHIVELLVVGTDDNNMVVAVDAGADHLHAVPDLAGRLVAGVAPATEISPTRPKTNMDCR